MAGSGFSCWPRWPLLPVTMAGRIPTAWRGALARRGARAAVARSGKPEREPVLRGAPAEVATVAVQAVHPRQPRAAGRPRMLIRLEPAIRLMKVWSAASCSRSRRIASTHGGPTLVAAASGCALVPMRARRQAPAASQGLPVKAAVLQVLPVASLVMGNCHPLGELTDRAFPIGQACVPPAQLKPGTLGGRHRHARRDW
jgi:hypothetical protein